MLVFTALSLLVLVHQSLGFDHLDELLKTHPTWSFEQLHVETIIKEAIDELRAVDPNLTEDTIRAKIEANFDPETTHIVRKVGDPKWSKNPPASFDAREHWKACAELINGLEDEGACTTDGPVVTASVASDRYCIHTNGTSTERLSSEMLIGCAESCTHYAWIVPSFNYTFLYGIPTGGSYKSNKGCLPYTLAGCKHSNMSYLAENKDQTWQKESGLEKPKPCEDLMKYDHECPTQCSNPNYSKSLDKDRKKFTAWYTLFKNEFHIRDEIFTYGPVATGIYLYDDFFKYPENGMYRNTVTSKFVARFKHLKLIGWGEEEGTKYWLAVNTWDNWGSTKVFKIPRGENHVMVEFVLYAGVYDP